MDTATVMQESTPIYFLIFLKTSYHIAVFTLGNSGPFNSESPDGEFYS